MSLESRGIVEGGVRLLVADHEPGVMPVGQRHRVHRAELADLGEQRERVVEIVGPPRRQSFGDRHLSPPRQVACVGPIDVRVGSPGSRDASLRNVSLEPFPSMSPGRRIPWPLVVAVAESPTMEAPVRVLPLKYPTYSVIFSSSLRASSSAEVSGATRDNELSNRSTEISAQYVQRQWDSACEPSVPTSTRQGPNPRHPEVYLSFPGARLLRSHGAPQPGRQSRPVIAVSSVSTT